MSNDLRQIELEYVYITIPAEYICVYHRILAMLADYGEEMLMDCKASCTDKNSGVIECFNMFNAAVAARKLGKTSLANTLINYIKEKINMIYSGENNETSFVFSVDENGQLKAFVSCGERPRFYINPDDGELYEHKFHNGFDEHFRLGEEDESDNDSHPEERGLYLNFIPRYELIDGEYHPCVDIICRYNGNNVDLNETDYHYYFDDVEVIRFNDVANLSVGEHVFTVVVNYKNETQVINKSLVYEYTN